MPRLPPSLLRESRRISPHLRALLPATRDLPSARNELRWIREHVSSTPAERSEPIHHRRAAWKPSNDHLEQRVSNLCHQRGRGVPLQYILGSQPFGHLDIACQRGVLIPRPETEAWSLHLGELIRQGMSSSSNDRRQGLRVVDLCTGTGCIALSLFRRLQGGKAPLHVRGVDISHQAVALARRNLDQNLRSGALHAPKGVQSISFEQGSVFDDDVIGRLASYHTSPVTTSDAQLKGTWDVLVSNPPYISRDTWTHGRGQMGFSVKKYEPRLALVPEDGVPCYPGVEHEDVFYWRLLDVAGRLQTRAVIFEVGDEAQALRVASMALRRDDMKDWRVELWRDWPEMTSQDNEAQFTSVKLPDGGTSKVRMVGSGNVRCVVASKIPSIIG